MKDPSTTPAGFVPATQYLALDEQEHLVGMTNLRHYLNDYLLTYGGRIGYSVRPAERQHGYATQMFPPRPWKRPGNTASKKCASAVTITTWPPLRPSAPTAACWKMSVLILPTGMLTQRYWIE